MRTLSIDRFLPAISEFSRSIQKGFAAKGLVAILFVCALGVGFAGFIFGADSVVALALSLAILFAFLFHVLSVYVQEGTVRQALSTKEKIEAIMASELPEESDRGEMFARLAISTRSLSTQLLSSSPYYAFIISPINRLLNFFAWKPMHTLAEVLFMAAIDQHIHHIRAEPTNLTHHAGLANCYVMLANHYLEPIKTRPFMAWPGIFLPKGTVAILESKARASSNSAIEELSILSSFAPDQLWVHDQLAISYRELNMPEREIEECEAIISLCPDDHQALLRLGILYFQQGRHAKGLEVYERLNPIQPLLAEELISYYGAYSPLIS